MVGISKPGWAVPPLGGDPALWRWDTRAGWLPPGEQAKGKPRAQVVMPQGFDPRQRTAPFYVVTSPPGTAPPPNGVTYTPATGDVVGPGRPGPPPPVGEVNVSLLPGPPDAGPGGAGPGGPPGGPPGVPPTPGGGPPPMPPMPQGMPQGMPAPQGPPPGGPPVGGGQDVGVGAADEGVMLSPGRALLQALQAATRPGAIGVGAAGPAPGGALDRVPGIHQNDLPLDPADAAAICGPAAALFLQGTGRMPTAAEAQQLRQLAIAHGWNRAGGMNGTANFQALARDMGVPTQELNNTQEVTQAVQQNRPVVVSTPNHYWQLGDVDPASGKYLAVDQVGHERLMSLADIASHPQYGGPINGIFAGPPAPDADAQAQPSAPAAPRGSLRERLAGAYGEPSTGVVRGSGVQGGAPTGGVASLRQRLAAAYSGGSAGPQEQPAASPSARPQTSGQLSPFDDVFRAAAPPDLQNNPEFLGIVAAGTKHESGWDPTNDRGDGGHSLGLFQIHDVNNIPRAARLDPAQASAIMVPRYAEAYRRVKAEHPDLPFPQLAALVAGLAERPLGYSNGQFDISSAAGRGYQAAAQSIQPSVGQMLHEHATQLPDAPVAPTGGSLRERLASAYGGPAPDPNPPAEALQAGGGMRLLSAQAQQRPTAEPSGPGGASTLSPEDLAIMQVGGAPPPRPAPAAAPPFSAPSPPTGTDAPGMNAAMAAAGREAAGPVDDQSASPPPAQAAVQAAQTVLNALAGPTASLVQPVVDGQGRVSGYRVPGREPGSPDQNWSRADLAREGLRSGLLQPPEAQTLLQGDYGLLPGQTAGQAVDETPQNPIERPYQDPSSGIWLIDHGDGRGPQVVPQNAVPTPTGPPTPMIDPNTGRPFAMNVPGQGAVRLPDTQKQENQGLQHIGNGLYQDVNHLGPTVIGQYDPQRGGMTFTDISTGEQEFQPMGQPAEPQHADQTHIDAQGGVIVARTENGRITGVERLPAPPQEPHTELINGLLVGVDAQGHPIPDQIQRALPPDPTVQTQDRNGVLGATITYPDGTSRFVPTEGAPPERPRTVSTRDVNGQGYGIREDPSTGDLAATPIPGLPTQRPTPLQYTNPRTGELSLINPDSGERRVVAPGQPEDPRTQVVGNTVYTQYPRGWQPPNQPPPPTPQSYLDESGADTNQSPFGPDVAPADYAPQAPAWQPPGVDLGGGMYAARLPQELRDPRWQQVQGPRGEVDYVNEDDPTQRQVLFPAQPRDPTLVQGSRGRLGTYNPDTGQYTDLKGPDPLDPEVEHGQRGELGVFDPNTRQYQQIKGPDPLPPQFSRGDRGEISLFDPNSGGFRDLRPRDPEPVQDLGGNVYVPAGRSLDMQLYGGGHQYLSGGPYNPGADMAQGMSMGGGYGGGMGGYGGNMGWQPPPQQMPMMGGYGGGMGGVSPYQSPWRTPYPTPWNSFGMGQDVGVGSARGRQTPRHARMGARALTPTDKRPAWTPPVASRQVVGTGHKFGEPVDMEGIHKGLDLQAYEGTPVRSPVDGQVSDVKWDPRGLGLQVEVTDPKGNRHRVAHLHSHGVRKGQRVGHGEDIARVGSTGAGSTGPHLDYRIQNPQGGYLNPEPLLGPLARLPRADK